MPFAIDPSLSLNENLSECVYQCHNLVKLACKYQVSYQHDLAYKHWMSLQSLTLQAFNSFHNQYSSEFLNDNLTQDELHLLNSLKSMKQEAGKRAHKCFEVIIASKMNSQPNPKKMKGKLNPSISSLSSHSSSSTSVISMATESANVKPANSSTSSNTKLNNKNKIPAINTKISNNIAKPQVFSPLVSSINDNSLKTWSILDINKSASLPGTQVTSPTIQKSLVGILSGKVEINKKQIQEINDEQELVEKKPEAQENSDKDDLHNERVIDQEKENKENDERNEDKVKPKVQSKASLEDTTPAELSSEIVEKDANTEKLKENEPENDEMVELRKSVANINFASATPDVSGFSENNIIEYYNDDEEEEGEEEEGYESANETKSETEKQYSDNDNAKSMQNDSRNSNVKMNTSTEAKSTLDEKEGVNDIFSGLLDDIQHHINGVSSNEDVTNMHAEESRREAEQIGNDSETNEKKFTRDIMTYFNNSKDEIDLSFLNAENAANHASSINSVPSDVSGNQFDSKNHVDQENIESDSHSKTQDNKQDDKTDEEISKARTWSTYDTEEKNEIDVGTNPSETKTQNTSYTADINANSNDNVEEEESSYYAIQIQDFKKVSRNQAAEEPYSPTEMQSQRIFSENGYIASKGKQGSENASYPAKSSKFINNIRRFNSEEFGKVKSMMMANKSSKETHNGPSNDNSVKTFVDAAAEHVPITSNPSSNFKTKFAKVFKK